MYRPSRPIAPMPLIFPSFPEVTETSSTIDPDMEFAMYHVQGGCPVIIAPTEQKLFVYTTDGSEWFDIGWAYTKEDEVSTAVKKAGEGLFQYNNMVLYGFIKDAVPNNESTNKSILVFDMWIAKERRRLSVNELELVRRNILCVTMPRMFAVKRFRDIERTSGNVFCKALNDTNAVMFV